MLIVMVSLLLFFALLLDIVRLQMAQAETEEAARASGRSLLSRFNPQLLTYGLFGSGWTEQQLDQTLKAVIRSDSSDLFDGKVRKDRIVAEPLYHLGDHTVFRRQVLEKMKYLAGIEFTREVRDKISRSKQQIAQAQQFAQLSQRLEALLKERERELDSAWEIAQTLVQTALLTSGNDEMKESDTAELQRLLNALTDHMHKAQESNDRLRLELSQSQSKGSRPPAEDAVVPHVSVLPEDYFRQYLVKAGSVVSLFGAAATAARNGDGEGTEAARARLADFASGWLSVKAKEEEKRQREQSKVRQLQADEKNKMDREVKQAAELIKDGCLPTGTTEYANVTEAYRKLEGKAGLYQKYKEYNEHLSSGGITEMEWDDGQTFGLQSLTMLSTISEMAEDIRDEVLVNEFALTFFTHRTWDNMKYPLRISPDIGDRASHVLKNQEAEYILYGFPNCMLNLSAAHTEVFGLRMAIRTIEALMEPKQAAAGSPILVLLAAMTEGAKRGHADTVKLLSGEYVDLPLLPGVVMSYKDHLRLFYMLHSRDASVLSRMQALIELNTTADLMKHYTAVRIKARSSPNVWVLKGIAEIGREAVVSY